MSWGFSYWKNLAQIGAQIGHQGPDVPNEEELKLLRRIKKHVK